MIIFWTLITLALLGTSITLWAAFRIYVLSSGIEYPEIQEDVPHDHR